MELLAPAALVAGAGALAALLVLYLARRRRARVEVPSLRLWREVQRELSQRTALARLRRSASLWMHVVALALIALALAAPAVRVAARRAGRLVLVVDTTASMGARTPDGRSRLDAARDDARAALRGLAPGSDAVLIEAGCVARVAAPATRDLADVARALGGLAVAHCGGDLWNAVALAADQTRGAAGAARVEVWTDEVTRAADLPPAGAARAVVHAVGGVAPNVGVTLAEVRAAVPADSDAPARTMDLFVALEANAAADVALDAELLRPDGATAHVAQRRVAVTVGRSTVTLPLAVAQDDRADLVRVTVSPGDALAVDDVAYAAVPRAGRLAVRLVSDDAAGSPFVARALAADPAVELTRETLAAFRARGAAALEGLTIFHGAAPAEPVDGDALVLGPRGGDAVLGVALGDERAQPRPTDVAVGDARVRYVTVDDLHVATTRVLRARPGDVALITSDAGPLVLARDAARGSVTVVGFDPHRSDWPLRTSFVLFLRAAVEHARTRAGGAAIDARRAGAAVAIPARGATSVRVVDPGGRAHVLPVHDGVAVFDATARVGVYAIERGARRERVALSLFDATESGLASRPLAWRGAARAQAGVHARERIELAPWALALAAVVLALEWWVFAGVRARGTTTTPTKAARS